MDLDWRPVTVDDVPAWNALLARSEEVDHTGEHYNEDDLVEELQDEAQGPDDRMGAWDGDKMVAFAAVRPREAIVDHWRIESEGTVDPVHRGTGLGGARRGLGGRPRGDAAPGAAPGGRDAVPGHRPPRPS